MTSGFRLEDEGFSCGYPEGRAVKAQQTVNIKPGGRKLTSPG